MRIHLLFFFLCSLLDNNRAGTLPYTPPSFDKQAFYKVMASESIDNVEMMFTSIQNLSLPDKEAYEGALLMKKAGLLKNKKKQLALFKQGKVKLEDAIANHTGNCEFRLLRLIVQEHAPAILGYNKQMKEDCSFIMEKYKSSPVLLQTIITDYSKQSKHLKLSGS